MAPRLAARKPFRLAEFGNFLWDSRFRKFVAVQAENGFSVFAFQQIAFGGSFLRREKADAAGGNRLLVVRFLPAEIDVGEKA